MKINQYGTQSVNPYQKITKSKPYKKRLQSRRTKWKFLLMQKSFKMRQMRSLKHVRKKSLSLKRI